MGGCTRPREAPTSAWSQRDSAFRAAARPGKSARRSCRRPLCRSWTGRRAGEAPEGRQGGRSREAARRWRPPPLPRSGPSWAGSGRLPRVGGRRDRGRGTEGEGSGNQVPREPSAPGPRRGSYLKGQGGRGHLRCSSEFSGLRRSWHSWIAGGGKKEGREQGPRCAAARNSPPVFARAGVGRGGIKFGCLAAQAAAPARPKGSGRWACLLLLVPYSLLPKFHKSTAST